MPNNLSAISMIALQTSSSQPKDTDMVTMAEEEPDSQDPSAQVVIDLTNDDLAIQSQTPEPAPSPVVTPATFALVAPETAALRPQLTTSSATRTVPTPGDARGSVEDVHNPSPEQVCFMKERIVELEPELKIAVQKYGELQEAFEQSQAEVKELTTTFANTADSVAEMTQELEQAREYEGLFNQYKEHLSRAQCNLQEQKRRTREVEARAAEADKQVGQAEFQAARNEENLRKMEVRAVDAEQQVDQAIAQAVHNEEKFNELKKQLDNTDSKLQAEKAAREDAEQQAATQANMAAMHKEAATYAKKNKETLKKQLADVATKLEDQNASMKKAQDRAAAAEQEAAQARQFEEILKKQVALSNSNFQAEKAARKEAEIQAAAAIKRESDLDTYAKKLHSDSLKAVNRARQGKDILESELAEAQTRAAGAELALNKANAKAETEESETVKKLVEKLKKLRKENVSAVETEQQMKQKLLTTDKALKIANQQLAAKKKEIENLEGKCKITEAIQKKAAERDVEKAKAVAFESRADSAETRVRDLDAENANYCNRFRQQEEHLTSQASQIENLELKMEAALEEKNKEIGHLKHELATEKENYRLQSTFKNTGKQLKIQERNSKKKAEEGQHRRHREDDRHRNGQRSEFSDRNKRPRENDRDYDNRNIKRNNNNHTSRGGDLRESLRGETRRHNYHNKGPSARRSSSSRSPPAPSPPPTIFQTLDDSSQLEYPPIVGPPTDPRIQPKKGKGNEEREEGECPAKKRVSDFVSPKK